MVDDDRVARLKEELDKLRQKEQAKTRLEKLEQGLGHIQSEKDLPPLPTEEPSTGYDLLKEETIEEKPEEKLEEPVEEEPQEKPEAPVEEAPTPSEEQEEEMDIEQEELPTPGPREKHKPSLIEMVRGEQKPLDDNLEEEAEVISEIQVGKEAIKPKKEEEIKYDVPPSFDDDLKAAMDSVAPAEAKPERAVEKVPAEPAVEAKSKKAKKMPKRKAKIGEQLKKLRELADKL